MSLSLGIDLRGPEVRLALLRSTYKKTALEALLEEPISAHSDRRAALSAAFSRLNLGVQSIDTVVCTLSGSRCFLHTVRLPKSAEKKVEGLLPFELEALLPVDISEITYASEVLPRKRGSDDPVQVFCVSAKTAHVRTLISEVRESLGREPERVGSSSIELEQLGAHAAPLSQGVTVILEVGSQETDLSLLVGGRVRAARSLHAGLDYFPARAEQFVAQVKHTLSAFSSTLAPEETLGKLVLSGDVAALPGLETFLGSRLELPVEVLDLKGFEVTDVTLLGQGPAYARAIASALHGLRGKGFDLRQGELAFTRGYGFLKEKMPLFLGMAMGILVSYFFATWAETKAIEKEEELLSERLEQITQATFQKAATDPDEALLLLEEARKAKPEDPMPYLDGFGAAVALAETLTQEIVHDTEQLEYAKGKLKIRGLVNTTDEAQRVAKALDEHPCIESATIGKLTQVVNSERDRYVLEADVRCPEEGEKKKKEGASP